MSRRRKTYQPARRAVHHISGSCRGDVREGWELQLAPNHLGHFNLTSSLHGSLAAAGGARVVSVSSNSHRTSLIVFDDLMSERRPYDPWLAYGQSKTGNILPTVEIARRWSDDGIIANALMPGGVRSGLARRPPCCWPPPR
ncbi:hypothetical protein [Actinoplanes sp. NPDC051411]|uniref:hypothetical protein n=1 Tax=Actinoplanes sp. NPDC051411 TaxID=3155522 RepID=UPI0034408834